MDFLGKVLYPVTVVTRLRQNLYKVYNTFPLVYTV